MKKTIRCGLLLCMTMTMLVGCKNQIRDMDETTQKMVVEYAVDVVKEYDINHSSRLMDIEALQKALEEEAKLEAVYSKDYSTEKMPEESDASENDTVETDTDKKADSMKETEVVKLPLAEALPLEEATVAYAGYEVTKSYPQDSDNVYFTMDASAGNELVVLKFDLTNTTQSDKVYDILSKRASFKIVVDGESRNALTTMLLNDLSNYQGTIAAGETEQLVLVCEVPEDKAQNISEIALNMKVENRTIPIALQ